MAQSLSMLRLRGTFRAQCKPVLLLDLPITRQLWGGVTGVDKDDTGPPLTPGSFINSLHSIWDSRDLRVRPIAPCFQLALTRWFKMLTLATESDCAFSSQLSATTFVATVYTGKPGRPSQLRCPLSAVKTLVWPLFKPKPQPISLVCVLLSIAPSHFRWSLLSCSCYTNWILGF